MVLCIDLYGKNDKVHQFAYENQTLSPGLLHTHSRLYDMYKYVRNGWGLRCNLVSAMQSSSIQTVGHSVLHCFPNLEKLQTLPGWCAGLEDNHEP